MSRAIRRLVLGAGCAVGCLQAAIPAIAGGKFDASGIAVGSDRSTPHPIVKGQVVVQSATDYGEMAANDTNSPMHGVAGPCFGTVRVNGEALTGGGYCVWKDKVGDKLLISWQLIERNQAGNNAGSWTLESGTGKWDGASGGGNYEVSAEKGSSKRSNRITGEITLK